MMRMNMRTAAVSAFLILAAVPALMASGMTSTKYNVFVPPNDDNNSRHASLIITALQDSTAVDVVDDGADGDSDDSWNGILMQGQSYFIKIREGAVNDDNGGKQDGDFFQIRTDKPVLTLNLTVNSTWEHDFIPADHKMTGKNFYLYAPDLDYEDPALVLFSYYGNTDVRLIDITQGGGKTSSGRISVVPDSTGSENKLVFNTAGEHSGLLRLTPGHTYHIISSKDISAEFGALYYEGGPWGNAGNAKDGAAYVPARNGSKVGQEFYFLIPGRHNDGTDGDLRELRIISYKSDAHISVYGTDDGGQTYDLISEFDLNQYAHRDLIGADLTANGTEYHFFRVVSDKNIAVFEGAWMETGNYGTSDMATSVSAEDGNAAGKRFTAYLAPPGSEPVGGVPKSTQLSHLYFYANDTTDIEVYDINSYGEYVELYNNADSTVSLADWVLQCFDGSLRFRAGDSIPAKGYFLLEYHERATDAPADYVYGTDFPDFRLRNGSDRLVLYNAANREQDRVWHRTTWTDHGNYFALERKDPTGKSGVASNWAPADSGAHKADADNVNLGDYYGTPGAVNSVYTAGGTGTGGVVVNEFMSGRIYRQMTIDYSGFGDFALNTDEWEALNNGDEPNSGSSDPEAPYITVESSRLLSVMNMNWNDNWYAYVGGLISPTPDVSVTPDYYQRRPGKPVTFTLRAYNTMFYALDSVVTQVDIPADMRYVPGSYTTSSYISGVTPAETQNADGTWSLVWNHGGKQMLSSEVYVFTVTASVDSGLVDSTFLQTRVAIEGRYDGDVFAAQDFANVLVGLEKSLSAIRFEDGAGDSTAIYGVGDTVRVRVTDDDEDDDAFAVDTVLVTVSVTTGTDTELLRLVETGVNTAEFRGVLPTVSAGGGGNNSGILTAGAGDVLHAEYTDADDPSDIASADAAILAATLIRIVNAAGEEVGAVSTTTDNDTMKLYAMAYDSLGNSYGYVSVSWSVVSVGAPATAAGESTTVTLTGIGSGYVIAVLGGETDSTGVITVSGGRAVSLTITPHTASGRPGDTLAFAAVGSDADGNITGDAGDMYAWTGGSAIGSYINTANASIRFILTAPGVDSLMVGTDYGLADTSGIIAATAGSTASVKILAGGADSLTTVSTLACTLYAYDGFGTPLGPVDGVWSVLPAGGGDFSADTGSITVFSPDSTGQIRIVSVNQGVFSDTVTLSVRAAPIAGIIVADVYGIEIDTLTVSADSPGIWFYSYGIDALGRPVALQSADWTFGNGVPIGLLAPFAGDSSLFVPGTAGSGLIAANGGGFSDTTGLITVTAGSFAQFIITIDTAAVTAGDSLQVVITATDGSGNPVSLPADLTWQLPPGMSAVVETTGTDTFYFVPTGTGSGQLIVTSPGYGVSDTSSLITVNPDVMTTIEIGPFPGDTLVMFLDETREFTVTGYDRFGNSTGPQAVRWDTTGNLGGTFTGLDSTTALTYTSSEPGVGQITATVNGISDAITIRVLNERVADIQILWPDSSTVGDTVVTADDDSLTVFAMGYNSAGTPLGMVTAVWAFTDSRIGHVIPVTGSSVKLIFTRAGSSAVTAEYQAGIRDTTGTFTVRAGAMDSLIIEPSRASMYMDDTLTFVAVGLDADGNRVNNPGTITWSGYNHTGTIDAGTGTYIPDTLGIDTVTAVSSLNPRFTAWAQVTVNRRPGYFSLRPERFEVNAGVAVSCTLVILDNLGNGYAGSAVRFDYPLEIVSFTKDGDSLVLPTGTCTFSLPGGDYTDTATIAAGYDIIDGRFVFTVTHDRVGEEVYFSCIDTSLNIGDTTDQGIKWLDPDILSDVSPYPSPMNFNHESEMSIEYRMRYPGTVTVRILSAMGSLAYEEVISSGDAGARSGLNTIRWNGRNQKGKIVGSGAFLVRIKVETEQGTMEQVKKVGVIGKK